MIKYLQILLLLCITTYCSGQVKYKTCTVYCKNHLDDKRSGIALKQIFNSSGKVVYEKEFGKGQYSYPDSGDSYNDTTYFISQTFYTYKSDTVLAKKMLLKKAWSDLNKSGLDTFLTFYYYNDNGQLEKELFTYYGAHEFSCLGGGRDELPEWGDSTITRYRYNNNLLIERQKIDLDVRMFAFKGLPKNRSLYHYDGDKLTEISNYYVASLQMIDENDNNKTYHPVQAHDTLLLSRDIYTYLHRKYTVHKISVGEIRDENVATEYTLDSQNRIINETIRDFTDNKYVSRDYTYSPEKRLVRESTSWKNVRTFTYKCE